MYGDLKIFLHVSLLSIVVFTPIIAVRVFNGKDNCAAVCILHDGLQPAIRSRQQSVGLFCFRGCRVSYL